MFEADHCQIGRWLAEDWGLPADLKEVIGCHHDPPERGRLDQSTIIHVSCRLADMLGFQAAARHASIVRRI
jgi:HD-like signal output (HDOD) protein